MQSDRHASNRGKAIMKMEEEGRENDVNVKPKLLSY